MKQFFSCIFSKVTLIHLLVFIVISIVGFWFFKSWLTSYTEHGVHVEVPDFTNLDVEAAQILAQSKSLTIVVVDTVFTNHVRPGNIVSHKPEPASEVKQNRTIYVTLNSKKPIMVSMPNAINVSLRQATQLIENAGLEVGVITYKPDFADNYVLEQLSNNRSIKPYVKLPKGSKIDLVVGRGQNNEQIPVPEFIGLSYKETLEYASKRGLIINCIFGGGLYKDYADSLNATVWKQNPTYTEHTKITAAQVIDLWFSK